MMNVLGKRVYVQRTGGSDSSAVPEKLPNKALDAAEAMEGRGLAKGNLVQRNAHRTQSRGSVHSGLERVREAVKKDRSSLSADPLLRHYPRQEPGALVAHTGICAGGAWQPAFLPRPSPHDPVLEEWCGKNEFKAHLHPIR